MASEDVPDKKLKIRPRGLDVEKAKEPAGENEDGEAGEDKPEGKKMKWDNRLKQSGKTFTSKYPTKPAEPPPETEAVKSGEASVQPDQESPAQTPSAAPDKPQRPEGWESVPPSTTPEEEIRKSRARKSEFKSADLIPRIRRQLKKRIRVRSALVLGFVTVVLFSICAWNLGIGAGERNLIEEQTKENVSVSKDFLGEVDQALANLRSGDTEQALKKLSELESARSKVASLTYLLALAAMQNGDIPLAEAKANESIAKRERVSDSLALLAVLETQKGGDPSIKTLGDTRLRSELLLRQAMLADAANPFPMIELATLLRYQKRNDEALALLKAARSRLNPVDSHTVIDVTIGLTALGETPDATLPDIALGSKDLTSEFSAAYIAMRKGDFDQAAGILKTVRAQTPPDLFDYLINDPTTRRYAQEPKLKEFFQ